MSGVFYQDSGWETEYWAVDEFVFPNMNKCRNFTHLSVLLPIFPVLATHTEWSNQPVPHIFLEHQREVGMNMVESVWFSNNSWISGFRMKIQKVCYLGFCLSFVSKIFAYLFEIPSWLTNMYWHILTALYKLVSVW